MSNWIRLALSAVLVALTLPAQAQGALEKTKVHIAVGGKAAFFFGEPQKVFARVWVWFSSGSIYEHLAVTLIETMLAFVIGTVLGLVIGLWLALSPTASAIFDSYIKAANSMPRVILAPIFSIWFGLGIWSKVALGVTLVFFVVFFNVYQGVREVSPVVLANVRMLGASQRQLLRHVYLPSATSGYSPACTIRWASLSSVRWWGSTWVRRAASAI